ncbi:MAG: FMN-binding negative transcriptional regulator [Burkholderiales bacterium]
MYIPPHNRIDDRPTLIAFMRAHSFATLVTHGGEGLRATHLPVVVEHDGDRVRLLAHVARANPQWRDFADGREAMTIFAEPHAYVSPRHYERAEMVPTWNYVAVHAYGSPRVVEDRDEKHAQQAKLIALHDAGYGARFPDLPREYVDRMLGAIVSFAIDVTRLDGRFKLSQEKLTVERERIIAELAGSRDSWATETADLMRKHHR